MEEFGAVADQCVMIGDRFYDIQGARSAGTTSIGVTFGTHKRAELEEADADAVVTPSISCARPCWHKPWVARRCGASLIKQAFVPTRYKNAPWTRLVPGRAC